MLRKKKETKSVHLELGLYSDLPWLETFVTLSIALSAYAWFIWRWFDLSADYYGFLKKHLTKSSLHIWIPGHKTITLRHKDPVYQSWEISQNYLWSIMPWYLCHHLLERTFRKHCPKLLSHVHVLVQCSYLASLVGRVTLTAVSTVICTLLAQPTVCYLLSKVCRPKMAAYPAWAMGILSMIFDRLGYFNGIKKNIRTHLDEEGYDIMYQIYIWGLMRTVSFCTTMTEKDKRDEISLAKCLGFFCYLPPSFLGPLMTFDAYLQGLDHSYIPPPSARRYLASLSVILRLSMTLVFHHVLIHCVYVGIMSYSADLLRNLDFSTLTAIGIFRVLDFSAMYAPTYGISQTVQKLDGYEPVPYPTCLAHVYRYSACWRLFDVGFYNYVKRYIYQPVMSIMGGGFLLGQFPAMVLVYAFVCVYHGATPALFRWTAFNFSQVLLESLMVKMASNSTAYASIMNACDGAMRRRIHAFVSVPSWFMGALTLQYFFSGNTDVGDTYIKKVFVWSTWSQLVTAWLVGYTGVQLAIEVNNYIISKKMKNIKQTESLDEYEVLLNEKER